MHIPHWNDDIEARLAHFVFGILLFMLRAELYRSRE